MGIRMSNHSYNTKLKEYGRHTSPVNLEQVLTEYNEHTKLFTHVRNLSCNQGSQNATTTLTQQRYGEELRQEKEQR